ncbi:hypothetical protein V1264_009894 [Littorina saxatilis]|uniref:Carbohydrate sulfotransferase n=2 Tax=Littorina saxatilis TaxID=31220 RepID=A0AAN9ANR5_9CAEN
MGRALMKLRRRPWMVKMLCSIVVIALGFLFVHTIFGSRHPQTDKSSAKLVNFKIKPDYMVPYGDNGQADSPQNSSQQHQRQQHQQKQQPQQQRKQQLPPKQQQQQQQQQQQPVPDQSRLQLSQEETKTALVMRERVARAKLYCQKKKNAVHGNTTKAKPPAYAFKPCLLKSRAHGFQLCPIAKIGSTFWARFYQVLRESDSGTLRSPYSVPLKGVENIRCLNENASLPAKGNSRLLKATFVREPFSRVFSAYVDKLISPNPIYWNQWGKRAMKRDGVTSDRVRCGQGVTFRQFLRDVNARLWRENNHVIPMAGMCDPCKESFDVIGKMETFPADLNYIMSKINVTFKRDIKLSRETKLDAIYDSIQGPFGWMNKIKACISTPEMGRRIWRKLQIRGLISSDLDYPVGEKDLTHMTVEEFNNIAAKAHDKSTDKRRLSLQKKRAFVEAFRTLSLDDVRDYVRVYQDDFDAFGYDKTPSSVFTRDGHFVDTEALDFDKPWRIPE